MNMDNISDIEKILSDKECFIILIDGNSGSGKTTFAEKLGKELNANVISIDNYYLPFFKRKDNWFDISGGNIDYFNSEDLLLANLYNFIV